MEETSQIGPFQLYKGASLKKVIEHYKEKLEWNEIQIITVDPFDINEFLKSHKFYEVSKVIAPINSGFSFLSYARDLKKDFEYRLNEIEKDRSRLKEDKLKILKFCIRICEEMESKYTVRNFFNFAFDFYWSVKDNNGFSTIPYEYLRLSSQQLHSIREEMDIRKQFFQWMKYQLELVFNTIGMQEFHDPMIQWNPKEKATKIKIAELFYALRSSRVFEFTNETSKKRFYSYIEKLFNLTSVNWADLESDIRKRKLKEKGPKWLFLKSLIQIKI